MIKIGVVKIDVDKAELEWANVNLSDITAIKGLLRYGKRFKYDIIYKKMFCFDMYAKENNHEILCLYIWLDSLIKKCKLSQKQQNVLYWHYLEGISKKDIAEMYETESKNIENIINTICKKILKQVQLNYTYDLIYRNLVKVKTNWKRCSRCGNTFPQTREFFSPDNRKKDGLKYTCKSCEAVKPSTKKNST